MLIVTSHIGFVKPPDVSLRCKKQGNFVEKKLNIYKDKILEHILTELTLYSFIKNGLSVRDMHYVHIVL